MRRWLAALLAVFTLSLTPPGQAIAGCPDEIVSTTPPSEVGRVVVTAFRDLCRQAPSAVACSGGAGRKPTLAEVQAADTKLRMEFTYRTDRAVFGTGDHYSHAALCGDCEDFALVLSERLKAGGAGGPHMGLIVWQNSPYTMHATLLVDTIDAGQVEVGVGPAETPHPMDWKKGIRIATLWMDGRQAWTVYQPAKFVN